MAQENHMDDPLYIHPSDNTGNMLIPFQLQGTSNYHAWSTSIKEALLVKNKLGFIDGSFTRLDVGVNDRMKWDRANAIVKAWLRNSVAKELVNGLIYNPTASSIWDELAEMFDKVDGTQIFQLTREIYQTSQGVLSITEYFAKMKQMWDALASIDEWNLQCAGDIAIVNEHKEKQRLMAFLLGLNESFGHIRSTLLMRQPLPTLSIAYSVLVQEESQRAISGSIGDVGEATALFTGRNPSYGGAPFNSGGGRGNGRGNGRGRSNGRGNGNGRGRGNYNNTSSAKTPPTCSYCHKRGHSEDTCYIKYGFPHDHPIHQSNPNAPKRNWNSANVVEDGGSSSAIEHVAAKDKRIFHGTADKRILHVAAHEDHYDHTPLSFEDVDQAHVNMAGMASDSMVWIVDSGATNHITHQIEWLHDLKKCDSDHQYVHLPNGHKCKVTHVGSCSFSSGFTLTNILLVPDFKFNLISVSRLPSQLNCKVIFTSDHVLLQGQSGKSMEIGQWSRGLYTLKDVVPSNPRNVAAACLGNKEDVFRWHRRLGHVSEQYLNHLDVLGLNKTYGCIKQCTICPLAKQSRISFPISDSIASKPFDLIHMDLWGPYKVPTFKNNQYFLTIVDDHSRATWVYLMKFKSDTFLHIKNFLIMVKTQFGTMVKTLRSDNGTEFINSVCKGLFQQFGIIHQTSCVHTPQQNGRVERKHRDILNIARALRFQASMPLRHWGYCILNACYLLNRLPSSILKFKSPMEVLYGKAPSLHHLKVIGCLCFATKLNNHDKFSPRADPCILMGYSTSQKGYLVMSISDSVFYVSRDVHFHEDIFPFSMSKEALKAIIPSCLGSKQSIQDDFSHKSPQFFEEDVLRYTPINEDPIPHQEVITSQPQQSIETPSPQPSNLRRSLRIAQLNPPPPRRSARLAEIQQRSSSNVTFGMEKYVSYDSLGPQYRCFLAAIDKIKEPSTYKQAVKDSKWVMAMKEEIQALQDNNTWEIVDLPQGKQSIGCKWVYKVKYNSDGSIERYKARLVAKGFTQVEGTDFNETFSPVVKMDTVRIVLALAAAKSWGLFHMDVNNAFLQGDLTEDVYMDIPQGFDPSKPLDGSPKRVCKLVKSLYGLKQASRQWNIKLTQTLLRNGYKQCGSDHSLFSKIQGDDKVFLLIYVDDLLITGSNVSMINQLKHTLQTHFKLKDLGELRYFLGLEIARSSQGLVINQRKYAMELIEEAGLGASKPIDTPMEFNVKLTTHEYDKATNSNIDDALLEDATSFRRLIGKLLYLTMTRPDISFSVQRLSQFVDKPKRSHYNAAIRVIKYIKGAPGQGLIYPSNNNLELRLFCDSDWAACPFSRKSVSAYCVKLGSAMIGWKVKKQDTISLSSAEAEYRCLRVAIQEALWVGRILKELGLQVNLPIPIHTDSQAAVKIAKNPMFHERTKHIELDCHFTRHHIEQGLIGVHYIPSKDQLADLLTKALVKHQHVALLRLYGIKDVFQDQREEEEKDGRI